jgi:hypothetical protein
MSIKASSSHVPTPGLFFQWLHILNLHEQDITRLCFVKLEWASKVVDLVSLSLSYLGLAFATAYFGKVDVLYAVVSFTIAWI